eukprot:1094695-Rhodomonas_salina.1
MCIRDSFIGGREKNSGKPEHDDRAFLLEHGLNVSGGEKEWAELRLLYKGGKHDMAFHNMGLIQLNTFAELYAME